MSKSTANKAVQDILEDDLDDTMPLPTLERLLEASEQGSGTGALPEGTDQVVLTVQLARLVELAEAMDGKLGQIAEALAARPPPKRSKVRKKTTKKTAGRKKSTSGAPKAE